MDKAAKKQHLQAHELDMDMMAESELAKLQRQYRIMEGDRKAFAEEAAVKLARQRKVIRALGREHEHLLADYKVAACRVNRQRDERIASVFGQMLAEFEVMLGHVKTARANLMELNQQIRKIERQVFELRPKLVTDAQCQVRIQSGRKVLQALENSLETEIKKFCAVLAENRKLREQIDRLLKGRARFNKIWDKLLNTLAQGKKFLLELVEQTTLAYDQREEWCNKLQALRNRGEIDLLLHAQEMRELQRQLDLDNNLQEFLGTKGQKRIMRDLELKEAKKREMEKLEAEKQLQLYNDTLQQIQEFTGEHDVERLAAKYLKQEEENFALFNYVNELNHELKDISDAITQIQNNIEQQKELNESIALEQKKSLSTVQEELETATKEADEAQNELNSREKELIKLLSGIERLFLKAKCDDAPMLHLLGQEKGVNNNNVMMYLGLIEKKIAELITLAY